MTGARQGYLEVHVEETPGNERSWSLGHGFSEEEIRGVQTAVSRGIIAEAVATGQTIVTVCALEDPRFRDRDSVRAGQISAALCAPIGHDPPLGVLYLQGRARPGSFTEDDRSNAEIFARHLAPFADRFVCHRRLEEQVDPLRDLRTNLNLQGIVGRSAALRATLRQIALVAPLDVSVLLTGESGTGKSELARLLHENGPRRRGPFVEVNCAALPESLIESELFGALPGAHSTATRKMDGKVAAAEGGTLVLDEVAELPLPAQAKLLQLLQSREYYPLGGSKRERADVRVIAATNADLRAAIAARRFREDLFYRLEVLPIRVPSLAERREDIPELAMYFCALACERHGLPRLTLSAGAVRAAQATDWPGNVRQLAHAIEAASIRAAGDKAERVEREHVFPDPRESPGGPVPSLTFQQATRRFQAQLLRDALETSGWNVMEAARRLDLGRSHVYNLIRAFGLERRPRTSSGSG